MNNGTRANPNSVSSPRDLYGLPEGTYELVRFGRLWWLPTWWPCVLRPFAVHRGDYVKRYGTRLVVKTPSLKDACGICTGPIYSGYWGWIRLGDKRVPGKHAQEDQWNSKFLS